MASKSSEQKRKQGRLRSELDGKYRLDGEKTWLDCTVIDISADGMALEGKKSFYVADKLTVQFVMDKRAIEVSLEITNLIGRKAGGKVTRINEADRMTIQEILNREILSGKTRID